MEAHKLMAQAGYDVKSYGTGNFVKIPGELQPFVRRDNAAAGLVLPTLVCTADPF